MLRGRPGRVFFCVVVAGLIAGCKQQRASVKLSGWEFVVSAMDMTGKALSAFCWPVRVYYEDTDSGGVVYYANYLKFMERARTEYLRSMGFEQDQLRQEQGILFTVHSLQVDFRLPARFNDALEVSARVSEVRRASLTFSQVIRRCDELPVLCDGSVRIACVDAASFKPIAIPEVIRSELVNER
jgi:acyl-CoA thioester hydrolase